MKFTTMFEYIKSMNKEQLAEFLFNFTCNINGGLEKIKQKENFGYDDFLNYLNKNVIIEK